jgi:D-psicose/D-tagatose/L-ribulose 3-epimerase
VASVTLSLSSLAFGGTFSAAAVALLHRAGIGAIELAPTTVWGAERHPSSAEITHERSRWEAEGIRVASLQSILYGKPELQLFDRNRWGDLRAQLLMMADIAGGLGASRMVFGAPLNRIKGHRSTDEAAIIAAEFFGDLAEGLGGIGLTLEPIPAAYGADFMTTYAEVVQVADLVDSDRIVPQVDTGCVILSGEDPAECVRRRVPGHIHVSVPGIGALPGDVTIDWGEFRTALREVGYEGIINIEILSNRLDTAGELESSIRWATEFFEDAS